MLIVPRSYQVESVDSIFNYFGAQSGNPVVAMPTGTGKSIVIAMFLYKIFVNWPRQKVMVLTHVKELIQQNYQKLLNLWPGAPAGINSAGLGMRATDERIIFAGIASVAKYYASFGHVDLLLIDECHLVSPNDETMYRAFIKGLKSINPQLKVVGLTATPWRLGHGKITEDGGIFTDVCFDITGLEAFNRLIAEGYVSPLVPKQPRTLLNVDGVHMRGHEFIASELQQAVDKDEITRKALSEAVEAGHNRKKWLIFASGVHHAMRVSEILDYEFNIDCPAVHSDLPTSQRDKHISDFRHGRIRAVVNNNVLTTGLDVPDIDLILMLRPTASPVLWVQMLGRGTRPAPGKENCLVLDFAGNTRRLGPINDPVIPQRKGKKGGDAPVKLCEMCETWNHASVRKCVNCGYEFPLAVKLKNEASTQELIKGDMPVVEVFAVDHITYSIHEKHDRPDAMKVSYHCGLKAFYEYICFDHEGYASRKARQWWRERTSEPVPVSEKISPSDEEGRGISHLALEKAETLRAPTHLRVWVNKKYPEILGACYDGSAFGSSVPGEAFEGPSVRAHRPHHAQKADINSSQGLENFDDDIPF